MAGEGMVGEGMVGEGMVGEGGRAALQERNGVTRLDDDYEGYVEESFIIFSVAKYVH